jgi:GT2 family glycosyltransferase
LKSLNERLTVIILTYNREAELHRTLERMLSLPEQLTLIVVDNASQDGTSAMVRSAFPEVTLISLPSNLGAAGRNAGARCAQTQYIAFCDDDTWWATGALERAVRLLDAHADVAVLSARVLVGAKESEDPACSVMASSPLPSKGLPGPALLGFLAGASVMRRVPFIEAGGYEPRFFIGGEEALLTLDLVSAGWKVVYVRQLTVHHYPSAVRDSGGRYFHLVRNALWVAWMRLPPSAAVRETLRLCRSAYGRRVLVPAFMSALWGLPWVISRRQTIAPETAHWYSRLPR